MQNPNNFGKRPYRPNLNPIKIREPIHIKHEKPRRLRLIIAIRNFLAKSLQAADRLSCKLIITICNRQRGKDGDIIFCTQYHETSNPERQSEILQCLEYNLNLKWLDSIFLFVEQGAAAPQIETSSQARLIQISDRLNFRDIFTCLANSGLSADAIIIIANSDIFLDASLPRILRELRDNDFVCLTRYETKHSRAPFMAEEFQGRAISLSQDAWIFRLGLLNSLTLREIPDLPLGIPGCENILASFIYGQGINISNPCLGIRIVHNHKSERRSYTADNRLKGLYAFPSMQTVAQFLCGRRPAPTLSYFNGHNYTAFSTLATRVGQQNPKADYTGKRSLSRPSAKNNSDTGFNKHKLLHPALKKQFIILLGHIESVFAVRPKSCRLATKKAKHLKLESDQGKRRRDPGAFISLRKEYYAREECIQQLYGVTAISSACSSGNSGLDLHGRELHLFTKHGIPIQHGRAGITLKSILAKQLQREKPTRPLEVIENALIAGCYYSDSANYYHFLCDAIPDIWMYTNEGGRISGLDAILMPYCGTKWQDEICQLIGIDSARIRGLHTFERCLIRSAHISFRAKGGLASSPTLHHSLTSIFKPETFEADSCPRKIYISRLGSKKRQLINELELIEFLQYQGYTCIDCSKESFTSQIRLFRNADYIIAPHGAALTNIAWCKPGTKVFDIIPIDHANPCFHDLAVQASLEYESFPSESLVQGLDPLESPVKTNIDVLKLRLKRSMFI